MGPSSAFPGGLGMFHLGNNTFKQPLFLLLFLCVVVGARGLGCSCGGGYGRRWLVVDRSSGGRRLVVSWSSVAGRWLVVSWSSAGRRAVVGWLSAGRRLIVCSWLAGQWLVVGWSSGGRGWVVG